MKIYNSKTQITHLPEWYWKNGLHDARIIDVQYYDLEYDFRCSKPLRNYLLISIDARYAMFDTTICAIKLYNYKIASSDNDFKEFIWKSDNLAMENDKFVLETTLSKKGIQKNLVVKFDYCELIKNT